MLLYQKSVADELKLNTQQRSKVRDLVARELEAMRSPFGQPPGKGFGPPPGKGFGPPGGKPQPGQPFGKEFGPPPFERMRAARKASDEAALALLSEKQAKRLGEIALRQRGAGAFADPKVAEELDLSFEQQGEIRDLLTTAGKQLQKLFQGGRPPQPETLRRESIRLSKTATDRILKLLTDEQKSKWRAMTGQPFKGTLPFPPSVGLSVPSGPPPGGPPGPPPGFERRKP
jgi:hypothetical protein